MSTADAHRYAIAGTLTFWGRTTTLDLDRGGGAGTYLLEVIRGAGPREGERMGWAAVELDDDGDMDCDVFPTRAEAERHVAWLLEHDDQAGTTP